MTFPLQIAFRNIQHSDPTEQLIRKKAAKLEKFAKLIISCRVVVEVPHRHHHKGNLYSCRLDVSVPGREITTHENSKDKEHENLTAAITDAFEAAERQLEDYKKYGKTELRRGA